MTGLFGRPADPHRKENVKRIKEFKKLVRDEKYDEAVRAGTEYLKRVPGNQDVLFTIGGIYYMKRRYKTSITYLDRALEIGSYDTEALLLKAHSHHRLGQMKQAIRCCKKIQEVDPKNKAVTELLRQAESDL